MRINTESRGEGVKNPATNSVASHDEYVTAQQTAPETGSPCLANDAVRNVGQCSHGSFHHPPRHQIQTEISLVD